MSEIRVNNLSNESSTGGPTISGITNFSGTNFFVPPVGNTAQRPQDPQKGALRFNTDTKHLEYFRGDTIGWSDVEASHDQLDGGTRGVSMGGETPSNDDVIQYITVSTLGNATDFGNLTQARGTTGSLASRTRGLAASGYEGGYHDIIDYVTISSTGNASDFGNLLAAKQGVGALANSTRGVFSYGSPSYANTMQYVTIASTGNAVDFGDKNDESGYSGDCASTTRGLWMGGRSPDSTFVNTIMYITIASTGNASDFGDLTQVKDGCSAAANATRGLTLGGRVDPGTPARVNNIDYVTIATLGNAADFGDLTVARSTGINQVASPTRACALGGYSPSITDTIDYVEIATTGNAVDFGNMIAAIAANGCCSNGHGGL